MRKISLEVDDKYGSEYRGKYVLRELSWAKKSRIAENYMKINTQTGEVLKSDYVAIQAETLYAAIVAQPENKPITIAKLLDEENGVPDGLFRLFQKASNSINGVDPEEARFLLTQLGEEDLTRLLQSLGFAKSSDVSPADSVKKTPEKSSAS
jgi:hypothetical protein